MEAVFALAPGEGWSVDQNNTQKTRASHQFSHMATGDEQWAMFRRVATSDDPALRMGASAGLALLPREHQLDGFKLLMANLPALTRDDVPQSYRFGSTDWSVREWVADDFQFIDPAVFVDCAELMKPYRHLYPCILRALALMPQSTRDAVLEILEKSGNPD